MNKRGSGRSRNPLLGDRKFIVHIPGRMHQKLRIISAANNETMEEYLFKRLGPMLDKDYSEFLQKENLPGES